MALRWFPYDCGFGTDIGETPQDILTLHIEDAPAVYARPNSGAPCTVEPLDTTSATPQSVIYRLRRGR